MKKISLSAMILLSSFYSVAQKTSDQNNTISDVVTITLPKGAQELTIEEIQAFIKDKKVHANTGKTIDRNKMGFYKVNNVKMFWYAANFPRTLPGMYLENMKAMYDPKTTPEVKNVEIKSINNYRALISMTEKDDGNWMNFYCINNASRSIFSGGIKYNKADSYKAEDIFNKLLKGLTFK